ncbi:hypothetical protein HPP92_022621 [Vanilla planifolia]|uniref:Uncharacterized protein n=1 Tax=Vanilla planifolia TaxID=51239 RepID=A0A835UC34_VANPL|nr:hypothetical protein HPP92_022621 [Vanilla planifolia]
MRGRLVRGAHQVVPLTGRTAEADPEPGHAEEKRKRERRPSTSPAVRSGEDSDYEQKVRVHGRGLAEADAFIAEPRWRSLAVNDSGDRSDASMDTQLAPAPSNQNRTRRPLPGLRLSARGHQHAGLNVIVVPADEFRQRTQGLRRRQIPRRLSPAQAQATSGPERKLKTESSRSGRRRKDLPVVSGRQVINKHRQRVRDSPESGGRG